MAQLSLTATRYPQPHLLPVDATPAEHVRWTRDFVRYCLGETRGARLMGLPDRKWLKALQLARFALQVWRERARRERVLQ